MKKIKRSPNNYSIILSCIKNKIICNTFWAMAIWYWWS